MEKELYQELYRLEEDHWWFAARRKIVLSLIRKYLSSVPNSSGKILDIGCGTGLMLEYLQAFGSVHGMDSSSEAVAYARTRRHGGVIVRGVFPDECVWKGTRFSLITMLDVLEHIEDDRRALEAARGLLEENGLLIITVPAYQFLWSGHDLIHHHKRRYTKGELRGKFISAGFQVTKLSYYNTILAPPIMLVRLLKRACKKVEPVSELRARPSPLNRTLQWLFACERFFLPFLNFPFGISIIAVVSKRRRRESD